MPCFGVPRRRLATGDGLGRLQNHAVLLVMAHLSFVVKPIHRHFLERKLVTFEHNTWHNGVRARLSSSSNNNNNNLRQMLMPRPLNNDSRRALSNSGRDLSHAENRKRRGRTDSRDSKYTPN